MGLWLTSAKFALDNLKLTGSVIDGRDIFEILRPVKFHSDKIFASIKTTKRYTDRNSMPGVMQPLLLKYVAKDPRASELHDDMCYWRGYHDLHGKYYPLSFADVNDVFLEGMIESEYIPNFIAHLFRFAVNFNPNKWSGIGLTKEEYKKAVEENGGVEYASI